METTPIEMIQSVPNRSLHSVRKSLQRRIQFLSKGSFMDQYEGRIQAMEENVEKIDAELARRKTAKLRNLPAQ